MQSPAPTHTVVPYQTPQARATAATGKAALGFMAAFAVVAIPVIVNYLNSAAATAHNTLLALGFTVGALFLGVVLTYAVNYAHASGSDTPPTVAVLPMQLPMAPASHVHPPSHSTHAAENATPPPRQRTPPAPKSRA